jgi:hypothetical protein
VLHHAFNKDCSLILFRTCHTMAYDTRPVLPGTQLLPPVVDVTHLPSRRIVRTRNGQHTTGSRMLDLVTLAQNMADCSWCCARGRSGTPHTYMCIFEYLKQWALGKVVSEGFPKPGSRVVLHCQPPIRLLQLPPGTLRATSRILQLRLRLSPCKAAHTVAAHTVQACLSSHRTVPQRGPTARRASQDTHNILDPPLHGRSRWCRGT